MTILGFIKTNPSSQVAIYSSCRLLSIGFDHGSIGSSTDSAGD